MYSIYIYVCVCVCVCVCVYNNLQIYFDNNIQLNQVDSKYSQHIVDKTFYQNQVYNN